MKKIKAFKDSIILIYLFLSICTLSNNLYSSDLSLPTISKADMKIFKKTLRSGDRGKWARALREAEKAKNPVILSISQWRWLTSHDGKASMQQTINFINKFPDWPLQTTLQKRVEERMNYNLPPVEVINWFIRKKAISGVGKIKLAETLLEIGANNAGEWLIKDSWKKHNFPSKDEIRIYKNYKNLFSYEDHNQRMDNLIWQKSWGSSRRQLKRLRKDFFNLYDARIKLARRRPGVDNAIARIPKEQLSDPGLIYERAKWRRRAGLNDKAIELLLNIPNKIPMPEAWWKEIRIHIRKQLSSGKIKNALHLAANHKQNSSFNIAEAEWLAGWMSLRFLKDPRRAYEHFSVMSDTVSMPISTARAAYWAGKAAESLGDQTSAKHWFQRSAALTSTFYGQLANHELNKNVTIAKNVKIKNIEFKSFTNHSNVQALLALNQANHYLSRRFAIHTAQISKKPIELQNLNKLLGMIHRIDLQIAAAKKATQNELYNPTLLFPIPDLSIYSIKIRDERVSLPMALAISRQESLFSAKAKSRAGALGIMQLMPRTAKLTSNLLKIPYSRNRLTTDPAYNIRLGTHYFGNLLEKYNGSYALALAAYNAGPRRANRWLKKFGDPRKEEIDPVDWVELIPIKETRNYVQRVIEGAQVYSSILPINSTKNINFAAEMFSINKKF